MKVREVLTQVLERFKTGDVPQAVAYSVFPPLDIPVNKWSFINRLIVHLSGAQDARGFRQWYTAGRRVKKGSKAIYILAPRFRKQLNNTSQSEDYFLVGFLSIPVFRAEDTEGEPLSYEKIKLDFKLIDKARQWGLDVKAIQGNGGYYGCYTGNEIRLATDEEIVFFHELAHHAHFLVHGHLKPGQDWKQEIVAELSAQTLCHIVGTTADKRMGNSYRYIERYAREAQPPITPITACLTVLSDVEKVLSLILDQGGS